MRFFNSFNINTFYKNVNGFKKNSSFFSFSSSAVKPEGVSNQCVNFSSGQPFKQSTRC